jgi:membrane protein implicated in regulation of membrane protease activity
MLAMMLMMMVCCMTLFLVIALVPAIGWAAGIGLFVLAAIGMVLFHTKFMRHGPRNPRPH